MLSIQQRNWFNKLTSKRENAVKVLEDEGLLKVFVSHIVDTYRESAHFIFELLQNADDVLATKVRFELNNDGILFAHNGKTNFSISDPALERKEGVVPGHINAITTFSLSTKKEDIENKIGKFGIGFKSVFQYTDRPCVINPPFAFTIENYMVPRQIEKPTIQLKKGETTCFWLPFDKTDKSSQEAYSEISDKLKNLKNPLLFLRNLTEVTIHTPEFKHCFTKDIQNVSINLPNLITVNKIRLNEDTILCFNQHVTIQDKDKVQHKVMINVGFLLNLEGKITADEKYSHYFKNAWCFFPTQQETKFSYLINAPFILTPNREALKEDRIENKQIVVFLGNLFESSIQALKTLNYINEEFYTTIPNPQYLPSEFKSIGDKIIAKLQTGEFIPTKEGDYVSVSNSYICTENLLAELLSYNNYQPLRILTQKSKAKIVFTERKTFSDQNLFVFFYKNFSSDKQDLQATWLGAKYSKDLLEKLPEEFCLKFFYYVSERSSQILAKGQPLWLKPFIPVINGDTKYTVTPNNRQGNPHVFLGGANVKDRFVLQDYLAADQDLKPFFSSILKFTLPDRYDDFLLSLKKYEPEEPNVPISEAVKDFAVMRELLDTVPSNKRQHLLQRLRDLTFLPCTDNNTKYLSRPSETVVYYPNTKLKEYFAKSEVPKNWVDLGSLKVRNDEQVSDLFVELQVELGPFYFGSDDERGLDELTSFLVDISLDQSLYLSELLFKLQHQIDYRNELEELRTSPWLFDKNGNRKLPSEIEIGHLHSKYPFYFEPIHVSLGAIVNNDEEKYSGLNEKEKAFLKAISSSLDELSSEEIKAAIANLIREKKAKKPDRGDNKDEKTTEDDITTPTGLINSWFKEPLQNANKAFEDDALSGKAIPVLPRGSNIWMEDQADSGDDETPGDLVPAQIIGNRYADDRQERKRQQFEKEIELEAKRNYLIELASQYEPYSFGWFKILLELEDNFTAEDRIKKNPVNVIFTKAEIDTDGLLILSETPFIPPTIEDLGDISIQIFYGENKRTIKGEIVSPQKRLLKIRPSNPEQLAAIPLLEVSRVLVQSSSPDFILERLKTAFAGLNLSDTDMLNSSDLLPDSIKFIFGPPGTGKTTFISWLIGGKHPKDLLFCKEPVTPFMDQKNRKVLVLTPTNKAGDVLAERILANYSEAGDYPSWLIRFGQTISLENEQVFVGDRRLPNKVKEGCTLITTIARYPYDYFKIGNDTTEEDWNLKDFNWDVIIFDEASMIQQSAMLFVIFYARQINPKVEFIVGGDPFQIPPIFHFEYPYWNYIPEPAIDEKTGSPLLDENGEQLAWKQDGGNIYSFVGLAKDDSFINPITVPHAFPVHTLMTQFRSIEPIGALFSNYRYGGKLITNRTKAAIDVDDRIAVKEINLDRLPLSAINLINFPVKKYGGVFKQQAIKGSPFQVYSALFVVELLRYFQANLTINSKERYRIGVISPYAKQNLLVTKLLDKVGKGKIEIVTGTVHGFQGDECDMVIVVLNPPKKIHRSLRSFLNKKNILNVAISRAKDKLVILSPFDPEGEINTSDLHQIERIKYLVRKLPECKNDFVEYTSTIIEELFWGFDSYIEDNCVTTSHQEVNIYTEAAKRYEIRLDESAMDVQVKPELFVSVKDVLFSLSEDAVE